MEKLNAVTLKAMLWQTLNEVKSGKLEPATADAIAAQSREILRATKIQLSILSQAKQNVTSELVDFAKPDSP